MSLVYLVEDDAALRSLLVELFEEEGHTVRVLRSVDQLSSQSDQSRGVAVVDGWGVDVRELGYAERQTIRQVSTSMPTIMLSGRAWVASATPEELGLVALLSKPTDLDALLVLIDQTLAALPQHST